MNAFKGFEIPNRGEVGKVRDRRGRFHLIVHCLRRWIRNVKTKAKTFTVRLSFIH